MNTYSLLEKRQNTCFELKKKVCTPPDVDVEKEFDSDPLESSRPRTLGQKKDKCENNETQVLSSRNTS